MTEDELLDHLLDEYRDCAPLPEPPHVLAPEALAAIMTLTARFGEPEYGAAEDADWVFSWDDGRRSAAVVVAANGGLLRIERSWAQERGGAAADTRVARCWKGTGEVRAPWPTR